MLRKPNKKTAYECSKCRSRYELARALAPGQTPRCLSCKRSDARKRARGAGYHKKPDYQQKARNWRLRKYYGMTPEQYEELNTRQGGKCAICFTPPVEGEKLVVDHDHATGDVRGLLCQNCNRGIGGLKESVVNLVSAMAYIGRNTPGWNWDRKYLQMALVVASLSKDPSTKVGAIIMGSTNEMISIGFNGPPRGVNDDVPERWVRPLKYKLCEHSERNAVFNAARHGACTMASTLYIASFPAKLGPCDECCRAIIQSGISRVVYEKPSGDIARWEESCKVGREMLDEAGVEVDIL